MKHPTAALAVSLVLAGSAGFMVAAAVAQVNEPERTVTIDIVPGERGPAGPAGPAGARGPAGPPGPPASCSAGSSKGTLVINAPGGQTTLTDVCLKR